jgi:hypothetical protein
MYLAAPLADHRNQERLEVNRPAVLRCGSLVEEITLLDLTTGGCRFTASTALPLFAGVSIGITAAGHHIAQIIWKDETSYGCVFAEPLSDCDVTATTPDNVAHILAATHLRQFELEGDMTYDEKIPLQMRVIVIFGLAAVLWAGLIAIANPLLQTL